jgi:hypothetical protein
VLSRALRRGRVKTGIHASLADPRRYERQVDRLHQRHLYDGGLHQLTDGEINLASVVMHRSHVARLLAKSVEKGEYEIRPAAVREVNVEGKKRTVFEYPLFDLIVHGVVADALAEAVEPMLSTSLYSYRTGVSSIGGVSAFARYLRRHTKARPDPRTRGVYVLRRDIDSYTDSIPLGARAPIWSQLREALERLGGRPSEADWRLVESVVRPMVLTHDGCVGTRLHGVATGQPISCVCFNVNLHAVDDALRDIRGAFYARYSDDLVFAHPDAAVVQAASDLIDQRVRELGLRLNADKRRDYYLTGAGRASADWPDARGTTGITFLGMRVALDGTVSLGPRRARRLLSEARRRAANTAQALDDADVAARGPHITRVINTLLDPDDAQLQGAAAPVLARVVTDRRQLEQLDHQLAQIVASSATGVSGARAFRRAPYSHIRSDWQLRSLRRSRDRSLAP